MLYPSHSDPELTFKIDELIDFFAEFETTTAKFMIPFHAERENKDENFTKFITKDAHNYFKRLEDGLNQTNGYLVTDYVTLADLYVFALVYKVAYNDSYDNPHIIQAVMAKYSKLCDWGERMRSEFEEFFKTTINEKF